MGHAMWVSRIMVMKTHTENTICIGLTKRQFEDLDKCGKNNIKMLLRKNSEWRRELD
jgi:hypothetical protein